MNQQDDVFDVMLKARQYICPVCHKQFSIPLYVSTNSYVYTISVYDRKTKTNLKRKCCSYKCFRKGKS